VSLAGMSKGGTFFEFEHNYYDEKGTNLARCEMMGAWMNLKSRKLAELPPTLLSQFQEVNKSVNYKELTTKDTRKWNKIPKDLNL
jgi:acyl-CoA thioester hydrolase